MPRKHTPGPWRLVGIRGVVMATNQNSPSELICVADCRTVDVTTDEALANARLIAAAPDLLAACKVMVAKCAGHMPDPRYPAWHKDCCEVARAAITKAEGADR